VACVARRDGWIERVCDANPNGFLDYARGESTGLSNQGWKDSEDSVFHADGTHPAGPIALVEVQGYAYAAFRAMSELAGRAANRRRGTDARAERLRESRRSALLDGGPRVLRHRDRRQGRAVRSARQQSGTPVVCGLPDARAPPPWPRN
jgi:glycogen debranching enzyme